MYCKNCGHKIEDENVKFCPNCGEALEGNTSETNETSSNPKPAAKVSAADAFQFRSVVTVILLSIFTCGIYSIYWFYVTANDLNNAEHTEEPLMNYVLAMLLTVVTCGIYQIYWLYKFFKKLDLATGDNNFMLNFLISIFLSPLVGCAIAQSSINRLAK